jgi:hypothetical protein
MYVMLVTWYDFRLVLEIVWVDEETSVTCCHSVITVITVITVMISVIYPIESNLSACCCDQKTL